jgi:dihydrofolate reductase
MIISLIVAASENNVIGVGNKLPWNLPDDLAYFQEKTIGRPIIMGRKTFESIGKPLPGRLNIIVTTMTQKLFFDDKNVKFVTSLEDAFDMARSSGQQEVFVIGGSQIFTQAFPSADRLYLTRVHTHVEGDVFLLPLMDPNWEREWVEISRKDHPADARHEYAFTFLVYERRR